MPVPRSHAIPARILRSVLAKLARANDAIITASLRPVKACPIQSSLLRSASAASTIGHKSNPIQPKPTIMVGIVCTHAAVEVIECRPAESNQPLPDSFHRLRLSSLQLPLGSTHSARKNHRGKGKRPPGNRAASSLGRIVPTEAKPSELSGEILSLAKSGVKAKTTLR